MTSSVTRGIGLWGIAATLSLSFLIATLIGQAWASDVRHPAVTILGSGSDLSVLITSGDRRVLIATGDDPARFSESVGSALPPTAQRLDLIVVAGTSQQLLVPVRAASHQNIENIVRLGPDDLSRQADGLPRSIRQLPDVAAFDLSDGVAVRLTTVVVPDDSDSDSFDIAWQAEVTRGDFGVLIVSNHEHVDVLPDPRSAAVIVYAGGSELSAGALSHAGAVVVNAAQVDGGDVRAVLKEIEPAQVVVKRVHPGHALRLKFTDEGVRMPQDSGKA